MKVAVARVVVVPRLLFRVEVHGMNKAMKTLHQTCQLMVGMTTRSPVSNVARWRDWDTTHLRQCSRMSRPRTSKGWETVNMGENRPLRAYVGLGSRG